MEKLLSSAASSHKTVPERFHLPPELRPPAAAVALVSLPVIDLSGSRDEVRRAVLRAGKELGFFQVWLLHTAFSQYSGDTPTRFKHCNTSYGHSIQT